MRDWYRRPEDQWLKALAACDQGHFGLCRDLLDRAASLDPRGEDDPRVVYARGQVRHWHAPFPASW